MIHIKLTVKGEQDIPPFTSDISYLSKTDEEIAANLVAMVKSKLDKNLRININESIALYSAFVISGLSNDMPIEQIQRDASCLLRPEQVMIGVPETLRKMSFEVTLDDCITRMVVLETPIRISDYIIKSS
ncbi:urease subunit gamma [Candidatus Nitrosotenuis aquarius]|uniref:urease subunit gamma n=1 Tax=Candidatus Nitrosotenuis aquarius TaxID=1846278 RepID=UPI000C1EF05B|nr:urease subunit gamma [Candidatus Nitrosotenuis aquarius]